MSSLVLKLAKFSLPCLLLLSGCATTSPGETASAVSSVQAAQRFDPAAIRNPQRLHASISQKKRGKDKMAVALATRGETEGFSAGLHADTLVVNNDALLEQYYLSLSNDQGLQIKAGYFDGWSMDYDLQSDLYASTRSYLKYEDLDPEDFYFYNPREAQGDGLTRQLAISQRFERWHAEVAAITSSSAALIPYADDSEGSVDVLRPSLYYSGEQLSFGVGIEHYLDSQEVEVNNRWITIDQRSGAGMIASYRLDDAVFAFSANSLYSNEMIAEIQALSARIGQFDLGYLHASNQFNPEVFDRLQQSELATYYASYDLPALFDIKPLSVSVELQHTTPQLNQQKAELDDFVRYSLKFNFDL